MKIKLTYQSPYQQQHHRHHQDYWNQHTTVCRQYPRRHSRSRPCISRRPRSGPTQPGTHHQTSYHPTPTHDTYLQMCLTTTLKLLTKIIAESVCTLCPIKTCHYIFYNNFNNKCPITIIFGTVSSQSRRHKKMVSFPTSPIWCNYLTLGNYRTQKMTQCENIWHANGNRIDNMDGSTLYSFQTYALSLGKTVMPNH